MGNAGHKMLGKELKLRGNRKKRLKSVEKILRQFFVYGNAILALPESVLIDYSGAKYVRTFTLNKISHKCFTLAFTIKSGYTLGFPIKIAHSGSTLVVAWSV